MDASRLADTPCRCAGNHRADEVSPDAEELRLESALAHVCAIRRLEGGVAQTRSSSQRNAFTLTPLGAFRVRQLYDLMLPVIFTLGMYGTRLQWRWTRKVTCLHFGDGRGGGRLHDRLYLSPQLFFTVGIPCIVCGFMAVWHVVRPPAGAIGWQLVTRL
jgi:hypothetical protein